MARKARACCLAGIDAALIPTFIAALTSAGERGLATVGRLDVSELAKLAPDLLVCDIDDAATDRLELLRQMRFVMPDCLIAVYTRVVEQRWGHACHLAGANCLLAAGSDEQQLADGLREASLTGSFTDPRFAA